MPILQLCHMTRIMHAPTVNHYLNKIHHMYIKQLHFPPGGMDCVIMVDKLFFCSIIGFPTVSPFGLVRSEITQSVYDPNLYYINVTWTPTLEQFGLNIFCYSATNSGRYAGIMGMLGSWGQGSLGLLVQLCRGYGCMLGYAGATCMLGLWVCRGYGYAGVYAGSGVSYTGVGVYMDMLHGVGYGYICWSYGTCCHSP